MSVDAMAVRPRRTRTGYGLAALKRDHEGWATGVMFVALLFAPQLGAKVLLVGMAAMAALFVVDWRRTLHALASRWFLLPIGLFAVLSFFWSNHPPETLRFGVQALLALAVGLRLSDARSPDLVLRGVFVAFALYMLTAVAAGGSVHVANGDETAFSGLTGSKNFLADMAVLSLLSALYLLASMRTPRAFGRAWAAWAGLMALIDLYALVAAHSAGALVGAVIAVGFMIGLLMIERAGRTVRGQALFAGLILAVVLVAAHNIILQALTDLFSNVFHKDSTLTGRAYLWYRARALVAAHPWLGTGFGAFWVQGDLEAEGLWRYTFIESRSGITFHNTYYNYLVDLGWIGLAIFLATSVAGMVAALRAYVLQGGAAICFCIALLEYEFARSPIEAVGLEPLGFTTILIYAALGWGVGAVAPARSAATGASRRTRPLMRDARTPTRPVRT